MKSLAKRKERPAPHRDDHHEMRRYLMRNGFDFDSNDLVYQLAFMITSHEIFMMTLLKITDPVKRYQAYQDLSSKIRFKAHSFDKYITMMHEYAKDSAGRKDSQDMANQRAASAIEYEASRMTLTMVCGKCMDVMVYPCETSQPKHREIALKTARKEGWVLQVLDAGEENERSIEVCPKCPAYRGLIIGTA
jgi:hypothetical protein